MKQQPLCLQVRFNIIPYILFPEPIPLATIISEEVLLYVEDLHGQRSVGIGFTLIMTLAAYGEPTTQEDKGRAKNMTWTSKGILIWFHEDKVNQIVVFQKK